MVPRFGKAIRAASRMQESHRGRTFLGCGAKRNKKGSHEKEENSKFVPVLALKISSTNPAAGYP